MTVPMQSVEGKVAIITGGAGGMGWGMAQAFLGAGMKVAIADRERLEQDLNSFGQAADCIHAIHVDVTDRAGMECAAAEVIRVFGKVHVLVNNAGVVNTATLSTMSYEEWDTMLAVNLDGVFNGIHAFLPLIKQHGEGGHIISTASVFGLFTVGSHYAAYCASKFAIVALMESLRAELSESNIGVSALCPGPVKTNLENGLKDMAAAMDPMEVGRIVLRGMQRNDLYIMTHSEFTQVIDQRHDVITASVPEELAPRAAMSDIAQQILERSVYSAERKRQH